MGMRRRRTTTRRRRVFRRRRMPAFRRKVMRIRRRTKRKAFKTTDIPRRMIKTLTYTYSAAIGAGAVGTWNQLPNFSANGAYDPYVAVGGGSPAHWALYASMFNHYTVLGSKMRLRIFPAQGANSCPIVGLIKVDDNAAFSGFAGAWNSAVKDTNAAYKIAQFGSDSFITLAKGYSPYKFFSVKDPSACDSIGASTSTVPADQVYFMSGYCAADLVSPPPAATITVEISYRLLPLTLHKPNPKQTIKINLSNQLK